MNHYLSDINSLKLLISLENTKSIGKTAKLLGLSQPAVSMRLKNFETRMGLQLVHKDPNGTKLTETGKTVVSWAKTIIDIIENYDDSIEALKENANNRITLGASQTIADYIMPYSIKLFKNLNNSAAIKLDVANSMTVADKVNRGDISLGFIESLNAPKGVHSKIVGSDELFIIAGKSHNFTKREVVNIVDLTKAHMIIREKGSGTREVFDDIFGALDFKIAPTELSSTTAIKAAISESDGITILSKIAIKSELLNSSFKILKLTDPKTHKFIELKRYFRAIWKPNTTLSKTEERLIKLTTDVIIQITTDEILTAKSNSKYRQRPKV